MLPACTEIARLVVETGQAEMSPRMIRLLLHETLEVLTGFRALSGLKEQLGKVDTWSVGLVLIEIDCMLQLRDGRGGICRSLNQCLEVRPSGVVRIEPLSLLEASKGFGAKDVGVESHSKSSPLGRRFRVLADTLLIRFNQLTDRGVRI